MVNRVQPFRYLKKENQMIKKTIPGILGLIALIVIIAIISTSSKPTNPETTSSGNRASQTINCFAKVPESVAFAGEEVPVDNQEVYERLDRELQINTYFHSSTIQNIKQAGKWFPVIEPILKKYQIPDDFKYMIAAESGFKNISSPKGASGFWQIMKTTAIEYGLIVNGTVDERYHAEKATEAACKYLIEAYKKYNNWTLTAASYNVGMARITKSLATQKVDNYYELYLNRETSRYVFRLIALKLIMSNPENFGFCFDENDIYKPVKYRIKKVSTSIPDLISFAKENNTDYKTLKYLNPWLRSTHMDNKSGHQFEIKLPA
jgi:peptidoglycan lytic transglycosylase D